MMIRRSFIHNTVLLIGGASLPKRIPGKTSLSIRFGIVTDVHYADKQPKINRYYKQSIQKLSECVGVMNREKVDFFIELGDFKDDSHPPKEKPTLQFLDTIEKEFQKFKGPCYHVLGNHDEDCISKQQFLGRITNGSLLQAENYYSFEHRHFRFIVLDANFRADGVPYDKGNYKWTDCHVPQKQLDWLKAQLEQSQLPSVVFIHQRLDSFHSLKNYCPDNADDVRAILEQSGKVIAVFQGHDHRGGFNKINNIPYYTLKGLITGSGPANNSYAIVEITKDFNNRFITKIDGYRKAQSVTLE